MDQYDLDNMDENYDLINVQHFLRNNQVVCYKQNYAFDREVQNFASFESFLTLSKDS